MFSPAHPQRAAAVLKRCVRASAVLLLGAAPLHAASFPQKEVTLVVPYPAGGSTDVLARLLSARLSALWGQPVVIRNIPGDSTVSGTQAVARAKPDGHTLLTVNATLAMNEALSRRLPYHALRSFAPVSLLARQELVLAVHADSPITTVEGLIATARASPKPLIYGSASPGNLGHLAGELLKLMTGTPAAYVPHKGLREALDKLAAKTLSYAIVPLPRALPYIESGQVRAIAVAGVNRATALPDVPTIGASVAGFGISTWIGLLAPYGASVSLVRQVNADVQDVLAREGVKRLITGLGYEIEASSPGEFQNRLRADIERYSRIVFEAGMRLP